MTANRLFTSENYTVLLHILFLCIIRFGLCLYLLIELLQAVGHGVDESGRLVCRDNERADSNGLIIRAVLGKLDPDFVVGHGYPGVVIEAIKG